MYTEALHGWEGLWGVTPVEFYRLHWDPEGVVARFSAIRGGLILLGTEQYNYKMGTLLSSEIIFAPSPEGEIVKPEPTFNKAELSAAIGLVCLPKGSRPSLRAYDLLGGQSVITERMSKIIVGDGRYVSNPK
ncbi:MAG TPA: hypothetical protein VFB59_05460 [Candidatus Saccharimonadales bacterium]|nr:hypothetical protein [Candidatus Saccharimonadales bacterium]